MLKYSLTKSLKCKVTNNTLNPYLRRLYSIAGEAANEGIARTFSGNYRTALFFAGLIILSTKKSQRKLFAFPDSVIFSLNVGVRGFEPPASWTRTMRAKPDCATPRKFFLN